MKPVSLSTVDQTVVHDLCLSCGICCAVCPVRAIEMVLERGQFIPRIASQVCTRCGLCLKLCPGYDIIPQQLRSKSFDEILTHDRCTDAYTVYTTEEPFRREGTSGGFISRLIAELLENREYDMAFLLRYDRFDGCQAMLEPVDNPDDVILFSKSKYVPVSVQNVVETILHKKSTRAAIVGTSCQIDGIAAVLDHYKIPRDNIFFCGMLCHRTFNFNAMRFYEDFYKTQRYDSLQSLQFRTKELFGWPGGSKLVFSSGKEMIVDQELRKQCKLYFQLNRCLFCFNKFNRLADISCGDCYIPEEKNEFGASNILIRTPKGFEVFERYKDNFSVERTDVDCIRASQNYYSEHKQHLEHALLEAEKLGIPAKAHIKPMTLQTATQRLSREQKLLKLGQQYRYTTIRTKYAATEFFNRDTIRWHLDTLTFGLVYLTALLPGYNAPGTSKIKDAILIVGGELFNKGAQAMTCAVVDYFARTDPQKTCYLLSDIDFERSETDKQQYTFDIVPWNFATKLRIAGAANKWFIKNDRYELWKPKLKNLLAHAKCMIDISGFAISSQFGDFKSFNYMLNYMIAQKFDIPLYVMPQSFGPFDYSRSRKWMLNGLIKRLLRYPKKIFVRENDGMHLLASFGVKHTELSFDLVLCADTPEPNHIYTNPPDLSAPDIPAHAIGIIPNKMLEKTMDRPALLSMYQTIIDHLINVDKQVVIVQHAVDDRWLCFKIHQLFAHTDKVRILMDDMPSLQLETIIGSFDWIIGSRYHSIIHAYKHAVPAIVVGWAHKYKELMEAFGQLSYCFDCRSLSSTDSLLDAINRMTETHRDESAAIRNTYDRIRSAGSPLQSING